MTADQKPEPLIITSREESNMVSAWNEYLCISAGSKCKYVIFTGSYEMLGDLSDYYDEDSEDYNYPDEVDGVEVVECVGDSIMGGDLTYYEADECCEFDAFEDERLKIWLKTSEWDKFITIEEVMSKAKNIIGN